MTASDGASPRAELRSRSNSATEAKIPNAIRPTHAPMRKPTIDAISTGHFSRAEYFLGGGSTRSLGQNWRTETQTGRYDDQPKI
jgi:hypothetical protein